MNIRNIKEEAATGAIQKGAGNPMQDRYIADEEKMRILIQITPNMTLDKIFFNWRSRLYSYTKWEKVD